MGNLVHGDADDDQAKPEQQTRPVCPGFFLVTHVLFKGLGIANGAGRLGQAAPRCGVGLNETLAGGFSFARPGMVRVCRHLHHPRRLHRRGHRPVHSADQVAAV